MNYQCIIDLTFLFCQEERGKHHIQTICRSAPTQHAWMHRGKKTRLGMLGERQPCLRHVDSHAANILGCTLKLLAIGERNAPSDRPVISQGNVGGTVEINMDYSSMTDSFRRAFCDLPSDLGLGLIQQGTF